MNTAPRLWGRRRVITGERQRMAILQNCTKAEVYDTNGTLLCPATVQSGPMDSILVITPDSLDHKEHDLFRIVFYDPVLGVLTCRCELSAPLDLPDHMTSYRCEILERLNQEQRRQDVKVSVAAGADVTIHVARQPGDHIQVVKEGYPATVLNISAGGVYLRTALPLQPDRRLWFDFKGAGETIPLTAQILRVDDLSPHPAKQVFGYGCRFVDLPARHESLLRGYVFQEDRRRRSQR